MSRDIQSEIATLLKQNPVVLFMKGTRAMPQCGFSATVVQCLQDADAAFF